MTKLDNQKILVDAGLGVSKSLTEINFNLNELSNIFITHLHSDHYLELGPLIHTAWTAGLKKKIKVFGPNKIASQSLHTKFVRLSARTNQKKHMTCKNQHANIHY